MAKSELIGKSKSIIKSNAAKKVLLYMFFVLVSAVFWVFNTANKLQIHDVELPFSIVNVPDSVMFLSDPPRQINVSLKETAINVTFKKKAKIEINFAEYDKGNSVFRINEQQLNAIVRDKYGKESLINSVMPDSISLRYVDPRRDVKQVPISLDFVARPNMQYEIVGNVVMSTDTATVYGSHEVLAGVNEVFTYHVDEKELKDTLYRKVAISPLSGVRIEPREITVMVPVEKLIKRERIIQVVVKNKPENVNVITFPSTVKVSYLVPQSQYNNFDKRISAIVDYNDILYSPTVNKVEVRIGEMPMIYKNVSLNVDSVEYIIEKLDL